MATTAEKTVVKKVTLFDKFYAIKDEVIAAMEKPLVLRATKRKFEASVDSCRDVIIKAEQRKNELCQNLKEIDLNRILEENNKITSAKETIEAIQALYIEFFGEEMKVAA